VRWEVFEQRAGRFAGVAFDRLIAPGLLLAVTLRRDGTPRLSPVEPLVLDGDLWLSMMWQSQKASDLLRDDRVLLHSVVTRPADPEPEVKIRGRAANVDDPVRRRRYCDHVAVLGWQPEEPYFHLFRIDLDDVTYIHYGSNGDQHVARWPSGSEFIRRATSATGVGPPEPIADLFADE
jgi:hypothetical protein